MIKYAKIIDETKGICQVGLGTDKNFYESIGMVELDVEKSEIDGQWFLKEKLQTEEYLNAIKRFEKTQRLEEIKRELADLDLKSIRALREGGDDDYGRSFTIIYQEQINALRTEMDNLEL